MEFDENFKKELLDIIERSINNEVNFSTREITILFHWVRHKDDPEYSFVPEKYREVDINGIR